MLKEKKIDFTKYDVGVIVGRFQTHVLHEGHLQLIDSVCANHKNVVIVLGVSPTNYTKNNPLDYPTREKMIKDRYPNILVIPIKDRPGDIDWSKDLDKKIQEIYPEKSIILYGGRDSFIQYYEGKYKDNTFEIEQNVFISSTAKREELRNTVMNSEEFRGGMCYAIMNQFDIVYPTIDAAIISNGKILLGQKLDENKFRFIGGFIDIKDKSAEDAVRREVSEEVEGIEISDIEYVGSFQVDDWRYRKEKNKIMTFFYKCHYNFGRPNAGDDLNKVQWFKLSELIQNNVYKEVIIKEHQPLFKKLIETLDDSCKTI